jgi:hypothetical protein
VEDRCRRSTFTGRLPASWHIGARELENRVLGVVSSEVAIVRGCDRVGVPIRKEKVSVD